MLFFKDLSILVALRVILLQLLGLYDQLFLQVGLLTFFGPWLEQLFVEWIMFLYLLLVCSIKGFFCDRKVNWWQLRFFNQAPLWLHERLHFFEVLLVCSGGVIMFDLFKNRILSIIGAVEVYI